MTVTIYGASDDLIEFEGDISEEYDYNGTAKKYYVYHEKVLQFTIQVKFNGYWEIVAKLDKKFDEDEELKCRDWSISTLMQGFGYFPEHTMVLEIDSYDDVFTITRKRK